MTEGTCAVCWVCGERKLRSAFYGSELSKGRGRNRGRCKACFRARINKATGRKSASFSLAESKWLLALCRALPSSDLCHLVRRPEFSRIARTATRLAGAEKEGTE